MLLGHLIRMLHAWKRYNACVRELSRLSDGELSDIGLSRSDIMSVAYRSAWDKPSAATSAAGSRIDSAADRRWR